MGSLIIGHTTESTARIWLRGDRADRTCRIVVESDDGREPLTNLVELSADADNTAIADFSNLASNRTYWISATFLPAATQVPGRFQTLPRQGEDNPLDFSFVLSSCNLSIISINNLLAYLLAAGGTAVGAKSLDLPTDRWMHPELDWLWSILKYPIKWGLYGVAWVVAHTTGLKQPGPPPIRSPFLKLSAVFDSWLLEYRGNPANAPGVGDTVLSPSGQGVVACSPKDLSTPDEHRLSPQEIQFRVVVTQVAGKFEKGEDVVKRQLMASDGNPPVIGKVTEAYEQAPWYRAPSFFLHVGDQIYYDFPDEQKPPAREDYRIAYREAWFADDPNRHLLSHWPHYMILDDHEIADQYARDFNPPPDAHANAKEYLDEAMIAYNEYVKKRNPETGHPWYRFEKGGACFFVLDARTERFVHQGQMIDAAQMAALLQWMCDNRQRLKFVITSVPFVAEINVDKVSAFPKWYSGKKEGGNAANQPRNPIDDKWTAFRAQREAIIDHIGRHDIENLVFLTGDMHCCYHASMRIGTSKYNSTTIHELAGGPVNQLQLADIAEFHTMVTNTTAAGTPYEGVLDRFHGALSAVMHIEVKYAKRFRVLESDGEYVPEVTWNVIRTLTDNGPSDWVADPDDLQRCRERRRSKRKDPLTASKKLLTGDRERAMAGTISFQKKRGTKDLRRW
jgi:phosphodiesterase/alkaline phosphatase D-like protein